MRPVDSNPQMGPGQTKKWPVKFPEWQVGREECVHSQCLLCLDLNHPNLRFASKHNKTSLPVFENVPARSPRLSLLSSQARLLTGSLFAWPGFPNHRCRLLTTACTALGMDVLTGLHSKPVKTLPSLPPTSRKLAGLAPLSWMKAPSYQGHMTSFLLCPINLGIKMTMNLRWSLPDCRGQGSLLL